MSKKVFDTTTHKKLLFMKKVFHSVMAALLLCSVNLMAQPQGGFPGDAPQEGREGRGHRFEMPKVLSDTAYAETKTAEMAEKYQLTDEQKEKVYALNFEYAPKLQIDYEALGMGRPQGENGERMNPRNMTDEQRQQFFQQMQERMAKMQDAMAEVEDNQKAFDLAIKEILTKDQYKLYKKDRRKEEADRQRRMQGGMGGPRGGMGGPGGGFGPRGGFGGGGFGGDDF